MRRSWKPLNHSLLERRKQVFSNNEVVPPAWTTIPTEINYIVYIIFRSSINEATRRVNFGIIQTYLLVTVPCPPLHLPQLWLAILPKTILCERHTSIHRITSVSTWPNSVTLKMKAPLFSKTSEHPM